MWQDNKKCKECGADISHGAPRELRGRWPIYCGINCNLVAYRRRRAARLGKPYMSARDRKIMHENAQKSEN